MIKKGFIFPGTIERMRQGPLSKHIDAYSAAQVEQGYGHHSIRQQMLVIGDFSGWLKQKDIPIRNLDGQVIDRFLRLRQQQQRVRRGDPIALKRLLAMLCQKGLVKPQRVAESPLSKAINEFQRYLSLERGLSQATLHNYIPVIEQFLSERFRNETPNVRTLCASDVTGFVVRQARRLSPVRAKLIVTALRSFFRYLWHRGAISKDLSSCVPTVPNWSLTTLPRFLTADDVSSPFCGAVTDRPPSADGTTQSCCCSRGSVYRQAKSLA
jgi:Phage integrase, N-terminal SAM-like domain